LLTFWGEGGDLRITHGRRPDSSLAIHTTVIGTHRLILAGSDLFFRPEWLNQTRLVASLLANADASLTGENKAIVSTGYISGKANGWSIGYLKVRKLRRDDSRYRLCILLLLQ
jgi:hypothetical protein